MTTKHYKGAMSACPRGKLQQETYHKGEDNVSQIPCARHVESLYSVLCFKQSKGRERRKRDVLSAEDYEEGAILRIYALEFQQNGNRASSLCRRLLFSLMMRYDHDIAPNLNLAAADKI